MRKYLKLLVILLCAIALFGCSTEKTDLEKVIEALKDCEVQYASGDTAIAVTQNITLVNATAENISVKWTSSDETVISNTGVVTRGTEDKEVTLTVTITIGNESLNSTFKVTVLKKDSTFELTTFAKINEIGNALESGSQTTESYYASGVISEVANTIYGNVYIKNSSDETIYIYGLYENDVRYDALEYIPVVGDTITVYGPIKNYNGTVELVNANIVEVVKGSSSEDPDASTFAQINAIGNALESGSQTEISYTTTGVITEVANTTYGNVYIENSSEESLYIYGLYDNDVRYDALDYKPVVGDTITISGPIKNYNGTVELVNAEIISVVKGEGGDTPSTITTIAGIHEQSAAVTAEIKDATVVGLYSKGYLLSDTTGSILVYTGDASTFAVGDVVTISGTTQIYNHAQQFTSAATVTKTSTTTYTAPTASIYTSTEVNAYLTNDVATIGTYVSVTGQLVLSGNYYNIIIDGTENIVAISYALESDNLGQYVDSIMVFKGYTIGSNTDQTRMYILFDDVEAATPVDCTLTIEENSTNAIVLDATSSTVLSGTKVKATVTTPEGKVATLTVNGKVVLLTNGEATVTITKDTTFAVTFSDPVSEVKIDFEKNFDTYASSWGSSYEEKTLTTSELGTTDFTAEIVLSGANKQASNQPIYSMPVSRPNDSTDSVTITADFTGFTTVTFEMVQWNTKVFTDMHIEYTTDGTTWTTCSDVITTPGVLSTNTSIAGATAVRIVFTASGKVQVGIKSITITK